MEYSVYMRPPPIADSGRPPIKKQSAAIARPRHDDHVKGPVACGAISENSERLLSLRPPKKNHSAATRCARAYSSSASSPTAWIGVKSRCAIQGSRVNLVMWLEQAQNVT